jgi:hypothetical protein
LRLFRDVFHTTNYSLQTRAVAEAIRAKDFAKAMSLRDPEFYETLEGFLATSTLEKEKLLPASKVSSSIPSLYACRPNLVYRGCVWPLCSKKSFQLSI